MASILDSRIADWLRRYQQISSEPKWKLDFTDGTASVRYDDHLKQLNMSWGHKDSFPIYALGRWYFDEVHPSGIFKEEISDLNLSDSDTDTLINLVMGTQPG